MSDATYQPAVYRKQGGSEMVVASGGTLTVESGGVVDLQSGATLKSSTGNLALTTTLDNKPVTINSRNYTQTSGDSIGFQTKPAQAATTTGNVYGAQLQPRVLNTFNCANMVGALIEPIIKGTGTVTGTISGDVRCLELIVSDEAVAGKTINNDVVGALVMPRIRTNPTGDICAIKVLNPKTGEGGNGSNEDFTCFAKLEVATGLAAEKTNSGLALPSSGGDVCGYIRVKVGTSYYKLPLYND